MDSPTRSFTTSDTRSPMHSSRWMTTSSRGVLGACMSLMHSSSESQSTLGRSSYPRLISMSSMTMFPKCFRYLLRMWRYQLRVEIAFPSQCSSRNLMSSSPMFLGFSSRSLSLRIPLMLIRTASYFELVDFLVFSYVVRMCSFMHAAECGVCSPWYHSNPASSRHLASSPVKKLWSLRNSSISSPRSDVRGKLRSIAARQQTSITRA